MVYPNSWFGSPWVMIIWGWLGVTTIYEQTHISLPKNNSIHSANTWSELIIVIMAKIVYEYLRGGLMSTTNNWHCLYNLYMPSNQQWRLMLHQTTWAWYSTWETHEPPSDLPPEIPAAIHPHDGHQQKTGWNWRCWILLLKVTKIPVTILNVESYHLET